MVLNNTLKIPRYTLIQNLPKGSPAKLITVFCLPLLIGNLIQQLYGITDILIVGRLLGINALAAVGATAPIFFVFLLLAFGFAGGLTVVTAQCFGAGNYNAMRKSVTHAIMASFVLCIFISVFLIFFLKPVLHIMFDFFGNIHNVQNGFQEKNEKNTDENT